MLMLHEKAFHVDENKMMLHQKNIFCAKKLLLSRTARHKKRLFFAITCRDHSLCEAFVVSVTFDLLCAFVTQN